MQNQFPSDSSYVFHHLSVQGAFISIYCMLGTVIEIGDNVSKMHSALLVYDFYTQMLLISVI
jgi:hypothetical protein